MIWFVIILAGFAAGIVGLFTRSLKRALLTGLAILLIGIILSILIILSGILGG